MPVAGKGRLDIINTTDSSSLATSVRAKGYRDSSELRTETANGSRLQADSNVAVHAGADASAPQDLSVRGSSITAGLNPDSAGRAMLRASGNVDFG